VNTLEANCRRYVPRCQHPFRFLLEASNMSGIVARNLSGLIWSPLEVPDETDGDLTGDPEDAV
jgi:hypothetical protein